MKKYKLKRLLAIGLGNLTSGIFFGAGCIIIEHIDNTWWQSESPSQQQSIAANENESSSAPALELTAAKGKNQKVNYRSK